MAEKKEKSITEYGPQTYRDLQRANAAAFQEAAPASFLTDLNLGRQQDPIDYIYEGYEKSPIIEGTKGDYYGNSIYDEPLNETQWESLYENPNEQRAQNQPWIAKLGSSIAQGTTLAGTTFLDGTLGLAFGIGTAIGRSLNLSKKNNGENYTWGESIAGLWDNEISNGLQEVNKTIEQLIPYYRTSESLNKPWYENLGSLDFWADGFLKNMGFTIGAAYSGAAWTKLLKAAKLLNSTHSLGAQWTGAVFSAVNEGRIEANQNSTQMVDGGVKILTDGYTKAKFDILESDLSDEEKQIKINELDKRYTEEVEDLNEKSKYMGNLDLLLNIPILTIDNFLMFGKLYSRGFNSVRNTTDKQTKRSLWKRMNDAYADESSTIKKGTSRNAKTGLYSWGETSTKAAAGKGLMTGVREGNEELAQALAAEYSTNIYSYDSPDAYYKAMTDPDAERKTMEMMPALSKAFADTYGNMDRYEEFAIGFLTGLFGTPTFGRVENADAYTYMGRRSPIGLSGGIFGEISMAKENNKRGKENVGWMNKLVERAKKNKNLMNQAIVFDDAMDGFSTSNNHFEYQNSKDNEMFRSIQAFLSAGREQDLMDIIDQDYDSMSGEELAALAGFTTANPDDKNDTSGWKDEQTGEFLPNTPDGIEKMRNALKEKSKSIKNHIKEFKNAIGIVRGLSNSSVEQTESEVNELAWLLWKSNRFKERISSIKDQRENQFTSLYASLAEYAKQLEEDLELMPEDRISYDSLTAKQAALMEARNKILKQSKTEREVELGYIRDVMSILRMVEESTSKSMPNIGALFSANQEFLEGLKNNKDLYNSFVKNDYTYDEYQASIKDLQDIGRLHSAFDDFMDKFNEYSQDPLKLKKNRNKIDKVNDKVKNAIHKAKARSSAKKGANREELLQKSVSDLEKESSALDDKADAAEKAIYDDSIKTKKLAENAQAIINKARVEDPDSLSQEDADAAQAVIENAVKNSSSTEDFINSGFAVMPDGKPASPAVQALVSNIVNNAQEAADEAEEMSALGEKAEETLKTTGNDAVDKVAAVNEAQKRANKEAAGSSESADAVNRAQKSAASNEGAPAAPISEDDKKINTIADRIYNINFIENGDTEADTMVEALAKLIYKTAKENLDFAYDQIIKVVEQSTEYENLSKHINSPLQLISASKEALTLLGKDPTKPKENPANEEGYDPLVDDERNNPETHISSEVVITDPGEQKSPDILKAWKRATAPVAFGTLKGQNKPYWETVKNPVKREIYKKIYEFLELNGALKAQMDVQKNATIYFTTDAVLNTSINEGREGTNDIVILMSTDPEGKNIVGDLVLSMDTEDKAIINFTERFKKEYEEWKKEDTHTGNFVYHASSTVAQTLRGFIPYTNSKEEKTDSYLNDTFAEEGKEDTTQGNFTLAIAMGGKEIRTTNQGAVGASNSEEERKIVSPRGEYAKGTPLVLVPTGKGQDKLLAVPFQMSTFGKISEDSLFYKWVEEDLQKYLSEYISGDNIDFTNIAKNIKQILQYKFSRKFHVNINNGQIEIHTGEKKSNNYQAIVTAKKSSNTVQEIMDALRSADLEIRVARSFINKEPEINIGGTVYKYNAIIGQIAHNNLGANHTVDDFFLVRPLNEKDEIVQTKKMKYPEAVKTPAEVTTPITYKGKEYKVTSEGVIKNKDDSTYKGEDSPIILALAEIAKDENTPFISTDKYWRKLKNGNLFYNKEGEERVVSDSKEISDIINSLTNKKEAPKEENKPVEKQFDKAFSNKKVKAVFEMLPQELQDKIKALDDGKNNARLIAVRNIISAMLKNNFSNKPEKVKIDVIEKAINNTLTSKFRLKDSNDYEKINLEEELQWLEKVLPSLTKEERVVIVNGLIKVSNSENPGYAWGKTTNGIITISTQAATGTVYHEAFHAVVDTFMTDKERHLMYTEGSKKYGIDLEDDTSALEIEENLAEDFRKYVAKEKYGVSGKLVRFFRTIKHVVQNIMGNESYINNLFYRINRGKIKQQVNEASNASSKYRKEEYTNEEKLILINAKRDSEGNLLAPNGKKSNLNEKQYAQVRTKAFKNWFGDWENPTIFTANNVDNIEELKNKYPSSLPNKFYHHSTNKFGFQSFDSREGNKERLHIIGRLTTDKVDVLVIENPNSSNSISHITLATAEGIKPFQSNSELENNKDKIQPLDDYVDTTFTNNLRNDVSKVVDENGEPLVVYHYSDNDINEFSDNNKDNYFVKVKQGTPKAIFFTANSTPKEGTVLDRKVQIPVFLNVKNIERKQGTKETLREEGSSFTDTINKASKDKDGVVFEGIDDNQEENQTIYVIFNPNDVKSAINNTGTFSKENNDIRYRLATKSEEEVKDDLQSFLDNFGIKLNDVSDYDGELPLFDALNRVINYKNINDITEGVGYAVAFMMQHDPIMQEVIALKLANENSLKGLRRSLRKRGDYEARLQKEERKALRNSDTLKEVGEEIAAELRKLYNLEDLTKDRTPYLDKVLETITNFYSLLTHPAKIKFNVLNNYLKNVANSIKLHDKTIILSSDSKPGTDVKAEKVELDKALEENPYEESIIVTMNKYGISLAGGASIAAAGLMKRPSENPLHDLDLSARGETRESIEKILAIEYPNFLMTNPIHDTDGKDKTTYTYLIMDRPFVEEREISGVAVYTVFDAETHEKLGTRVGSDLVLKEGVQGKMVDFFTGRDASPFGSYTTTINGKEYLISDYRNAMEFKVTKARDKDVWDYNNFLTDEEQAKVTLNELMQRAELARRVNQSKIIWGHPAIGKTEYLKTHNDILEWDELINEERNQFIRDRIDPEHSLDTSSIEYKNLRSDYMSTWKNHPEYINFLRTKWEWLKDKAQKENKKIFASPLPLIELFSEDFDLFINLTDKDFTERNIQRGGGRYATLGWKELINEALVNVDSSKIVNTSEFFSEVMNDYDKVSKMTKYRAFKVDYDNLNKNVLDSLEYLGISKETYNKLTIGEKENLIFCFG